MASVEIAVVSGDPAFTCDVRLGNLLPAAHDAALRQACDVFAAAVNVGMLSGAGHDPARSSLEAVDGMVGAPGAREVWRYRGQHVDPGAFRVLRNMLTTHLPDTAADLVLEVRSPTAGAGRTLDWSALSRVAFPAVFSRVPFELNDEVKDPPDREVIVRIEFQREVADDHAQRVVTGLEAWEGVVREYGFADPEAGAMRQRPPLELGEHHAASPLSIEYGLYWLNAPADAFNGIVNLLIRVAETEAAIATVDMG